MDRASLRISFPSALMALVLASLSSAHASEPYRDNRYATMVFPSWQSIPESYRVEFWFPTPPKYTLRNPPPRYSAPVRDAHASETVGVIEADIEDFEYGDTSRRVVGHYPPHEPARYVPHNKHKVKKPR